MSDNQSGQQKPGKTRTRASKSVEAGASPEPAGSLIQVAFPQAANIVFFSALTLGVLLIGLVTVLRQYTVTDGTQANLLLCIGAALVLAAFGGQATVRIGSFVLAGVAAVAVALFFVLQDQSRNRVVGGRITSFDDSRFERIEMKNENPILGRVVVNPNAQEKSWFDFAIFENQLSQTSITVTLDPKDKTQHEIPIFVNRSVVDPLFGTQQRLEWELKEVSQDGEKVFRIFDLRTRKPVDEDQIASNSPPRRPLFGLIGSAYAQDAPSIADLSTYLDSLTSDDTSLRRAARDALGVILTPDVVPTVMARWRNQPVDYRVRLGVSVALTEMLRRDKSQNTAVAAKLTDDDRNLLLDAAGDPDRTIRVYATEFLFDLGDPRVTQLALARAANTPNDTAKYNWLFAAQDGWRRLSATDKSALGATIGQITGGQKTMEILSTYK
jgi:hypothetical protein